MFDKTNEVSTAPLKTTIIQGAAFLFGKRALVQIVISLTNIVLARILLPAEFGVYAVVIFTSQLLTVFADVGLSASYIQKKEQPTRDELYSIFTVQAGLGCVLAVIYVGASPFIVQFFQLSTTALTVFRFYALIFLLTPFKAVSLAILERNLQYKKVAVLEIIESVIACAVMLISAVNGWGVFSFVIGTVTALCIVVCLYLSLSKWTPRFVFKMRVLHPLIRFGLPFQNHILAGLFYGPVILLYLGKVAGTEELGYYQFSAGVAALPLAISEVISRLLFPLVSRSVHDRNLIQKIVAGALSAIAVITVPLVAWFVFFAPHLLKFVFTDKWLPVLPALRISLVASLAASCNLVFTQVLLALGKTTHIRRMSIFMAVSMWIIAPLLIQVAGFVGMSVAVLAVSSTGFLLYRELNRVVSVSFSKAVVPFLWPTVAALIAAWLTREIVPSEIGDLIIGSLVGILLYVGLIWYSKKTAAISALHLFKQAVSLK